MPEFRVIDLRSDIIGPEHRVEAVGPEEAAHIVIGAKLRAKGSPRHVAARVYWNDRGAQKMLRLYFPAEQL